MKITGNKNIVLISAIMALMVTALFLIVKVTPLFIIAYLFAIISIALFCFGSLYMISNPKSYPWFVAFPIRIWQYLILEFILSAIVILIENLSDWSLPVPWFIFLHIIILAICLITLIMLKSGKDVIDKRGEEVKQKVATLRFMQADVESLIRKFPEYEKGLKSVAEALRYSDPMSHQSLAIYEEQIQRGIISMSSDEESIKIPERCAELLRQIADRNARVKILK
jgi:hypothetical protein